MRLSLIALTLAIVGCAPSSEPTAETAADSLAMDMIAASGGWGAWSGLHQVRFDFVVGRDSAELFRARHFWSRHDDRARVEWNVGEDSTAVVILDLAASTPDAASGEAWVNGEVSPPADSLVAAGYSRWVNDTYWLAAPLKVMDPGVNRALAPDSARGGERVLALSFGEVGLTPGDRYWFRSDAEGRMTGWTYVLEGSDAVTMWDWDGPQTLASGEGAVTLRTRKTKRDGTAITTPVFDTAAPTDAWTSPLPILQ